MYRKRMELIKAVIFAPTSVMREFYRMTLSSVQDEDVQLHTLLWIKERKMLELSRQFVNIFNTEANQH